MASAIPMANSPLFVSSETAVVIVLVKYLMLPPIIIATPTSSHDPAVCGGDNYHEGVAQFVKHTAN